MEVLQMLVVELCCWHYRFPGLNRGLSGGLVRSIRVDRVSELNSKASGTDGNVIQNDHWNNNIMDESLLIQNRGGRSAKAQCKPDPVSSGVCAKQ